MTISPPLPSTTRHLPPFSLSGVPQSAGALVLSEIMAGDHPALGKPKTIVHVSVNDRSMSAIHDALAFFAPQVECLNFPAWDCLPYDRVSPRNPIMAERMHTLAELSTPTHIPRIVLTTAAAILQKLPPMRVMQNMVMELKPGHHISQAILADRLIRQGYRRSGKAMEPGEFALRGGIVDITPPDRQDGVRVDFFGDDIESMRVFDPMTQVSQNNIDGISLYPTSEIILNEEHCQLFRTRYRELFGAVTKEDPLYEAISHGQYYPGMEHWLPLFYDGTATFLDYCGDALFVFDSDVMGTIAERHETIHDYYDARLGAINARNKKHSFAAGAPYHPLPPDALFIMEEPWQQTLAACNAAVFSSFASRTTDAAPITLGYRPVMAFAKNDRSPFDQLKERVATNAEQGRTTLIACYSHGSRERLFMLLMERGFHCLTVENWAEIKNLRGKTLGIGTLPLETGFETNKVSLISEQDLLGERIIRTGVKKKKSEVFLRESANFSESELVVHKEHGIGRFAGLVTLTVSGAAHDCLKIVYEGDDKLFLPVENIEMVSRFGLEEEGVKLDKLGGVSWQARKARLKERITIAAETLLKTAAERQLKSGAVIDVSTGAYQEFCARFAYPETEDQERSIEDVLSDLHAGKPMDRLICGDVGFGKTEVALRAAFIVASNKHQVVLICPTTLLARQHYKNFKERFAGFPITIQHLSRMVPAREQKDTREKLASGEVNIVIGTHALLSKNVAFKNLGLVIVDEEQHFGVGQKEKLKELKTDVHVLTLSATPIPRTLQMALTGVRDLSLITTPPIDRLAIRSFVMPFDPVVIREALVREQHRGGRSFIVCPRIKDIPELKKEISELVPELKIAVAHGQMAASELDGIMNDFYDGGYDALISTAIIESGLDIPAANTMVVYKAYLFGLAQLYQLRGRIGRGKLRAYAYFLLPHHKELTKNATKRLEVMQTLDTLGAGFTLASHDMDIRGFGNLVGEEQSGHIREVGIELYQQMLEEAVAALKSKAPPHGGVRSIAPDPATSAGLGDWSPQINLGLSVLIPETYVGDLDLRMGLYRRVANFNTEAEIESFAAELIDRFGDMPEEVGNLITILGLKLICKKAGIERIDVGPKGAVISFHHNTFANPDALLKYIERNARHLKARPDQKLVFSQEWQNKDEQMPIIKKLVTNIASLIN